jgi:hypothetical protein
MQADLLLVAAKDSTGHKVSRNASLSDQDFSCNAGVNTGDSLAEACASAECRIDGKPIEFIMTVTHTNMMIPPYSPLRAWPLAPIFVIRISSLVQKIIHS